MLESNAGGPPCIESPYQNATATLVAETVRKLRSAASSAEILKILAPACASFAHADYICCELLSGRESNLIGVFEFSSQSWKQEIPEATQKASRPLRLSVTGRLGTPLGILEVYLSETAADITQDRRVSIDILLESAGLALEHRILQDSCSQGATQNQCISDSEYFRVLADSLPGVIWRTDPRGVVHFYNRYYYEFTGINERDPKKHPGFDLIHPEDLERFKATREKAILENSNWELELRIKDREGKYRWFLARSQAIRDSQGKILERVGTSVNIDAQKRAQENLHSLLMQAPVAITIITGPEMIFEFVNPKAQEAVGDRQFLGRPAREVFPEPEFKPVFAITEEAFETGQSIQVDEVEILYDQDPNRARYFNLIQQPLRNEDGKVESVMSLSYEVTDQVRARREAEKQSERFRTLVEQAPAPYMIFSPEGDCLYANPAWEDFWATSRDALKGYNFLKDVNVRNNPELLNAFVRATRGERLTLPDIFYDPKVNNREGRPRWIRGHCVPIKDKNGRLEQIIGTLEDITDSKIMMNALENQRKWQESLLNLMPIPLMMIEPDTLKFTFRNQACMELTMVTTPGIPELNVSDLHQRGVFLDLSGKTLPFDEIPSVRAARGEKVEGYELLFRTPKGEKAIMVHAQKLPAMYGYPSQVALVLNDVTGQKDVRNRLREAVRARDEFLSMASHELKTPLTALKLQTLITRRNLSIDSPSLAYVYEEVEKMLGRTDRHVDALSKLVDDMLDITRIDAGKISLELEEVDLGNLVREVSGRLEPALLKANCEMTLEVQDPIHGYWDRFRIEQVLMNILVNAIQYGPKKPIHVRAWQDQDHAFLEVEDQGIGISPADQTRIFEKFERASAPKAVAGMGIGLFIVNEMVKMHGGQVSLKSEVGKGSCFTVTLPLRTVHP